MNSLLAAFGMVLVIEGILPFLAPKLWREGFRKFLEFSDGQMRFIGLIALLSGLALVVAAR